MTVLQRLHEQYLHDASARIVASTEDVYRAATRSLWPFRGIKQPKEVGVGEINLHLLRLSHQFKGSRVKFIRDHIMRFWRWLEDNEHIEHSPLLARRTVRPLVIPPTRRPIMEDQYRAVMAVAGTPWRELCAVGWHTGLRYSDVAGLRWDQIDWESRVITTLPRKIRRFNKTLTIPMADELVAVLRERKEHPRYPALAMCEVVFPELNIASWDRVYAYTEIQKVFRRAGLPKGYSFHSFRHAFCTRLSNDGVSPLTISAMTGQSLRVLQTYVKVSVEAKRAALGIK